MESIRYISGSTYDGFSIACDDGSRWCHAACFGIVQGEVPEEWCCRACVPQSVDRDGAVSHRRHRSASTANNGHSTKRKRRASIFARL
jgi:hypothetical protein